MTAIAQVGNVQAEHANGVHAAIRRLSRHLLADGHHVEIWHFSRKAPVVTMRTEYGLVVVDLPVIGPRGALGAYLQVPTADTRRWLQERAGSIDVLHLHSVFQPDHAWTASLGLPYVTAPHGGYVPDSFRGARGLVKRAALHAHERRMLERARTVQVLSVEEDQRIRSLAPRARTATLHFPLDEWLPGDGRYRPDGPVLFLGRLDVRHKGLDLLLDAAADSRDLFDGRTLTLVGPRTGGSPRWLRQRADELGIGDVLDIRPPVRDRDEVRELLASSALFVHPSRWEGLPTAVLEAMATGIPVLVSRATNLADLVSAAECGAVTEVDARSVAAGLRDVLGRAPAARAAMGRRGQDTVRAQFSWERLRSGYQRLYSNDATATRR